MIEFIKRLFLGIFLVLFVLTLGLFWLLSPLFIWRKKNKKPIKEKKGNTTFNDIFRTLHQN